jgi:hypothetical protein
MLAFALLLPNPESSLSVIGIREGLRTHGRFLVDDSEDELLDIDSRE